MAIILVTDKASKAERQQLEDKGSEIGFTCPWSLETCHMVIDSIEMGRSLPGRAAIDAARREAAAYHIFEGLTVEQQDKIEQRAAKSGLDLAKLSVAETLELIGVTKLDTV